MRRLLGIVAVPGLALAVVSASPAQTGPPPPARFSSAVGPGSDDRQPWKYRVDGTLVGQKRPTLCSGKVEVVFRLNGKIAARHLVGVRTGIPGLLGEGAGPVCGYRSDFSLRRKRGGPRRGTFVVTARFQGNAEIAARSAPAHRVRFGR